jgi:2-polyprenyl-3-methyl-5-hydroxy-6-metoxy-1,4-benzoquinol methylase
MTAPPNIIIQASSRAWSGGRDICLNEVDGKAPLRHLVEGILAEFQAARIGIAAPAFDREGLLPQVLADFADQLSFVFAHDASPLQRLIETSEQLGVPDFLRINGLNMWVQPDDLAAMWQAAQENNWACIKFPDAYPAQLTFDYYRRDALETLAKTLSADDPAQVHPKYRLCEMYDGHTFEPTPPEDSMLKHYRKQARQVYRESRDPMTAEAIAVGDTLGFHYELALDWLKPEDRVLDIACGGVRGPQRLAERVTEVIAADIDGELIAACRNHQQAENIYFEVADVTHLPYKEAQFDAVTSFETLEHVDPAAYFNEIARVLKPGGLLIFSTPQNSLGHIPINPQHHIEYSLPALKAEIAKAPFEVAHLQGIKQGRVMVKGDETGSNSFGVLRRS